MSFLGGYTKALKKGAKFNLGALSNPFGTLGISGLGGGGDPGREQLAQILGTLNQAKGESDIGYAQAGAQLRRQIPIIQTAYKKQGENLRYLSDATKRSVADRETSALARARAATPQGSNLAPLVARGVRGDTTRAMAELDRMFGGQFGDLATNEASDLSNIARQQANLTAQGVGARNSLYGAMADAYGQQQFQPKKDLWDVLGGVAPIIGTFAGLGSGGGGPAGVGGIF